MARILIVPGLAVRTYMKPPAEALVARGHDVSLLAAPSWRGAPTDPDKYGRQLAAEIERRGDHVDLLIGLSVGTQVAASTARYSDRVKRVLLVSPTVDPLNRSLRKLTWRWRHGDSIPAPGEAAVQLHVSDWLHAGPGRIAAGFLNALRTQPLEQVLPQVSAEVTVVHPDRDLMSTAEWDRSLAVDDAHFIEMSEAPHSWPVNDSDRFVRVVEGLLA